MYIKTRKEIQQTLERYAMARRLKQTKECLDLADTMAEQIIPELLELDATRKKIQHGRTNQA